MKVILNRDVPNLGEEGDVCEVARGYARNFLMPRNMVLIHNRQNMALIEGRRASIEQRKVDKRKDASSTKERIESEELVIRMAAGERGKLFGSVTTTNIVDELEKRGVTVERRRVEIPDGTIKSVGAHQVRVRLYGEEEATLTVRVETETPAEPVPAQVAPAQTAPAPSEPASEPATETETEASETASEASTVTPVEEGATAPEQAAASPVEEQESEEAEETTEQSSI